MAQMAIDLDEVFDGDLYLPVRGKMYRIAEPTAKESERLRVNILTFSPDEEIFEMRKIMGESWNELLEDGVGWCQLMHMGRTTLLHFTFPPEVAREYWKLGQLATLFDLDQLLKKGDRHGA